MDRPAPFAPATLPVPAERVEAYDRYGPDLPETPVIVSIPHAGRVYPPALLADARVGAEVLRRLEDRWVDLLAHRLIAGGFAVLVARTPRAFIDLNRHERELDPAMVAGLPRDVPLQSSAKLRGGLGLVPRRLAGVGDLWRGPLPWRDMEWRIETLHRPYHAAITRLMLAARRAHGHAILVDLHSMPPLAPPEPGRPPPGLVLGDRFGRSAADRLVRLAADVAAAHQVTTGHNHPYAGDHMLERHGRPAQGRHALQLEVDRALYLDAALDGPGPGLARATAMVTEIGEALACELPRVVQAMAAE